MSINEWQVASQSHCGNVRKVNEDSILALTQPTLLAVAAGMGGHQAGDVASQMLIEELSVVPLNANLTENIARVNDAILASNESIINYSTNHLDGQTVGTTVVVMLSDKNTASCLWAGDSRLYRLRKNQLEQLTHDHSHVAELIQSGLLQPEDAYNHPSSNIITRSVGVEKQLSLDQVRFDILSQDTFLLCSDGLYSEVAEGEMVQAMQAYDIYRGSNWLLNLCLGRAAKDNISFIIARALDQKSDLQGSTLTFYPDNAKPDCTKPENAKPDTSEPDSPEFDSSNTSN